MACAVPCQCAPRFRTLLRAYLCVPLLLCASATVLASLFFSAGTVMLMGAVTGCAAAAVFFLPQMLYERMYYTRHANWLKLERGLFVRSIILIPRRQVICTRLRRGPLERILGLSTVILITTAGRVTMPGLAKEDAARLRQLIDEQQRHLSFAEEQ